MPSLRQTASSLFMVHASRKLRQLNFPYYTWYPGTINCNIGHSLLLYRSDQFHICSFLLACAANFYMDSGSCVPCPNNTMRASGEGESGCSCNAGYVRTPGASTMTLCFGEGCVCGCVSVCVQCLYMCVCTRVL